MSPLIYISLESKINPKNIKLDTNKSPSPFQQRFNYLTYVVSTISSLQPTSVFIVNCQIVIRK